MTQTQVLLILNNLYVFILILSFCQTSRADVLALDTTAYRRAISLHETYHFFRSNEVLLPKLRDRQFSSKDSLLYTRSLNLVGNNYLKIYNYDSAFHYYSKALEHCKLHDINGRVYAKSLIGLAYASIGKYDFKLVTSYVNNLSKYLESNQDHSEFHLEYFTFLGVLNFIENPDSAKEYFKQAYDARETNSDLYSLYIWSSDFYAEEGQSDTAIYIAEKAVKFCKTKIKGDTLRLINGQILLGFAYHAKGDVLGAIATYEKALKLLSNNNNEFLLSEAYRLLGWSYELLGDYASAIKYKKQNLKLKLKNRGENDYKTAEAFLWLSGAYDKMGFLNKSLSHLEKAIEIYQSIDSEEQLVQCYILLSKLKIKTGEYIEAVHIIDEVLKDRKYKYHLPVSYYFSALAYLKLDSLEKAKSALKKSMEWESITHDNNSMFESRLLNLQCKMLEKESKMDSVRLLLEKSLVNLKASGVKKHLILIQTLNQYIHHCLLDDKLDKALILIDEAILTNSIDATIDYKESKNVLNLSEMVKTLHMKAEILEKRMTSESKKEVLLEIELLNRYSLDLITAAKMNFASQEDLISQQAPFLETYKYSIEVLIQLFQLTKQNSYLKKVFEVIEKGKSAVLLNSINANRALDFNIPDSLTTVEATLKKQISHLQTKIVSYNKEDTTLLSSYKESIFQSQ